MKALKWVNTGAFVAMVTVNALAELLPIGGKTTGEISSAYPNLFTPAPMTFSIWGLIYFLMMLFVIYQHGVLDGGKVSIKVREKIGLWFSVSCMLNILWIFMWHHQMIGFSTLCIALLLVVLGIIAKHLREVDDSFMVKVTTKTGFSLYYGWIIAATIANVSVYLTQIGWEGWGIAPGIWTILVLLVGAGIACAMAIIGKNPIAAMAVMWAYAGILVRHVAPIDGGSPYLSIIATIIICEILILGSILFPKWMQLCQGQMGTLCQENEASKMKKERHEA